MMMVFFLTGVLVFMGLYSLVFIRSKVARILFFFVYVASIYFIWNPAATTLIANFFGIGRGLDFFLILLCVLILNALVMLARQVSLQNRAITRMARHIAIGELERSKSKV